ncbi:MAG: hypothetical protein V5A14_02960 [Desulfohalobiaceae bacterium]
MRESRTTRPDLGEGESRIAELLDKIFNALIGVHPPSVPMDTAKKMTLSLRAQFLSRTSICYVSEAHEA